jgi:two-component system, chemotaxis family, sensor kinase CheA
MMEPLHDVDAEDLQLFLVECQENLNQFEQDTLNLESNGFDPERVNRLYRALHTIKGNCGFLPLPKLESIAHAGETLLGAIRTAQCAITPEIATVLLQLIDTIRHLLKNIETKTTEGNQDYSSLITMLRSLCPSEIAGDTGHTLLPLEETDTLNESSLDSTALDTTLRVPVELLDQMMNLVGELVLARNRVMQVAETRDATFKSTYQQLNLITNELQNSVMRTRLQPISTLWRNLPRLVRDVAIACKKEVSLTLEGSETELDRSIITALKDPLTHLVRNCIDHGIERTSVRMAKGKVAQGNLTLRASQESGKVILEIRDDGAGIDPAHIKGQAQKSGLISSNQAESMADAEVLDLIFTPGFSTAAEVTHVSGRGVGMDVVRRNLERVNGSIEVESKLGQGTTFRLKIPLTLAIQPTLLIRSGGERFAIPQGSIQELLRIEGQEQITQQVETLLGVPVYRLRGQILPLVDLAAVLQLTTSTPDVLYIVVIANDGYQFGLIVDQVEDTQDIVVKPLSKQLKSLDLFAGATILGNGSAALILDAAGLARHAAVQRQAQSTSQVIEQEQNRQLILIFLGPHNTRMGIVLSQATRLETLPKTQIEQVGQQYLMQYRDRIVSLIDLQSVFGAERRPLEQFDESLSVVVMTLDNDRHVGLIVNQILDIVEDSLTRTNVSDQLGVQCYTTLQGQITEILNLREMIDLASHSQNNSYQNSHQRIDSNRIPQLTGA